MLSLFSLHSRRFILQFFSISFTVEPIELNVIANKSGIANETKTKGACKSKK